MRPAPGAGYAVPQRRVRAAFSTMCVATSAAFQRDAGGRPWNATVTGIERVRQLRKAASSLRLLR